MNQSTEYFRPKKCLKTFDKIEYSDVLKQWMEVNEALHEIEENLVEWLSKLNDFESSAK